MYRGGTASYYHRDGLVSVTSLTDSSGVVAASYVYDSFGNLASSTGSATNSFRYTGRELDSETGLYYYRARYYDPAVGRFLSEDPIRFTGGANFFRYVDNSPTTNTDPSGLWSPAAHDQIIWNALHPCGVSNSDIYQIQQGSRWFDGWSQSPVWSPAHSMSNGTIQQSAQEVMRIRDGFVRGQSKSAQNALQAGATSQAMFTLGIAIHPLMDMTSPAHTDANGNPIPWCGYSPLGCSNLADHILHEGVDDLNANPHAQEIMNVMIRNAYEAMTGRKFGCACGN